MARLALLPLVAALCACPARSRPPPPPDAPAARDVPSPTHVCYGPGGSAVEVVRATSCASLGGSEVAPMEVRPPPAVRRDGGTAQPL